MLWMILQFLAYTYAVALLILVAVFVLVASYLKVSRKLIVHGPATAPIAPFRRHRFRLHRKVLAPVSKHPPRVV